MYIDAKISKAASKLGCFFNFKANFFALTQFRTEEKSWIK